MKKPFFFLLFLFLPVSVQAQYEDLLDNTAHDLGAYTCTEPVGAHSAGNYSCKTITNFSGWAVDKVNSLIYMFGGGHASTAATTMMKFTASTGTWASDSGLSTPCTAMVAGNFDATNVWWTTTQQPTAQHTYQSMVFSPVTGKIVRMRQGTEVGTDCIPAAGIGTPGMGSGQRFHEYDPLTHTWTPTATNFVNNQNQYAAADFDPPSGLAVQILAVNSEGLRTYDFAAHTTAFRKEFISVGDTGYAGNLIYFPPNQKHYLFDRNHNKVWELTLDRTTWANSTLVSIPITGVLPPLGYETGWDYDSDSQVICGAVYAGTITCFNPLTRAMTRMTMQRESNSLSVAIGYVHQSHTFAFLPAHHAFFFISSPTDLNPDGEHTWVWRYRNTTPPAPPICHLCEHKVYNPTTSTQTNRIMSYQRPFKKGDIEHCAHVEVDGTPVLTQCNVRNRWPDGSVALAQISYIIPSLPASGNVQIDFYDDTVCNDTGGESKANMLANYDFDGTIEMTAAGPVVQTISARAMLTADKYRVWFQGPIVTAVIIEDRTTAQSYDTDFGDASKSLHPIFEAWFYPQGNKVEMGYTIENMWSSATAGRAMRNLTYSLVLKSGNTSPVTRYTEASFIHIIKSRWHKRYWIGSDPPAIRIDHNLAYLATTRVIPNYDTTVVPTETLIASNYTAWTGLSAARRSIAGSTGGVGNYDKGLGAPGVADWIGLMNTWDVMYLYTMQRDDRMLEKMLGNADLAGRIPWHFREADTLAGQGDYFDVPTTGSVDTFGKVISLNARKMVWLLTPNNPTCGGGSSTLDTISASSNVDGWTLDRSHMPSPAFLPYLLTGRYYYLEELQLVAAFVLAENIGCTNPSTGESGHWSDAGYLNDHQIRGDAWGIREVAYAAFLSPDGTSEKAYFDSKLKNNFAEMEGVFGQPLTDTTRQTHWTHGATNRRLNANVFGNYGIPPLGFVHREDSGFLGDPLIPTSANIISAGATPYEQFFLAVTLGIAKEFGYNTQNLLNYLARLPVNLMMNPGANKYDIQMYRLPTTKVTPREWVQTYVDLDSYWSTGCDAQMVSAGGCPPTAWGTAQLTSFDHSYTMIARAALSFLVDITVDGYSGLAAYNKLLSEAPLQNPTTGGFATNSPKWAIVARTDTVPIIIPPDQPPVTGPSHLTEGGMIEGGSYK